MHSCARSLAEPGQIKVFIRRIFLADDFQELEGPCMPPCPFAWTQRAECLADCSLLVAAGHGDNRARRVNSERSREVDFILCGRPRGVKIGGTEVRDELRREHVDGTPAIELICFDDLRTNVERPSDCDPKKPARNALRALPCNFAGPSRANAKAPDTAHSPGAAGLSKTNESEASSWMVRNGLTLRFSRAREDSILWCARSETAFRKVRSSPLRQTPRDSLRTFG
jgi:hypothetical protein